MNELRGKTVTVKEFNGERKIGVYKYPDNSFLCRFENTHYSGSGKTVAINELRLSGNAIDLLVKLRDMVVTEEEIKKIFPKTDSSSPTMRVDISFSEEKPKEEKK